MQTALLGQINGEDWVIMNDNFTTLLVILAMISVVSWIIVGLTAFVRFAARVRYRHRHSKMPLASEDRERA